MPRHGLPLLLLALVALCFNALFANAQFGNMFQNMFGQEQTHQQQHFQNHHGANVRGWQIQDEGEHARGTDGCRVLIIFLVSQLNASTDTSAPTPQIASNCPLNAHVRFRECFCVYYTPCG
jgi:hypothetical protein